MTRPTPIAADVLVVDEASMIDLDMMARVLAALPPDARLILLGDPHQLPSVDTGNVLADICAADPEYSQAFCELAKDVVGGSDGGSDEVASRASTQQAC